MTYARARLWLGITGVGSLVVLSTLAILLKAPQALLGDSNRFGFTGTFQLATVVGLLAIWLMPFDFIGGYLLPRKFNRSDRTFASWFGGYLKAAIMHSALYVLGGFFILLLSQQFGFSGGLAAVSTGILVCFVIRNRMVLSRESKLASADKLLDAIALIQSWEIFVPKTVVVDHEDVGFTGGIIGLGRNTKIVIPRGWLRFTRQQLAVAIARRAVAINSGSYTRGLLVAFVWNAAGFMICATIPGAGLSSVAGFVMTACAFTLWSFIGLLILPTISRNASLIIDEDLVRRGMPTELIAAAAESMDQMQDGEPHRSRLIETIFHPVPNVTSRNRKPTSQIGAWNAARTTLFFSWACLGALSRSVHCNVGRPELWTMLPTD